MGISIRPCTKADLPDLQRIGIETYRDTFGPMNEADTMEVYLGEAFCIPKLSEELARVDSRFYFLHVDGELAGYLKLNRNDAQTELRDTQTLEIERIYVRKEFQGRRLGHALIQFSIDQAVAENKAFVWLGVWEKNAKALSFYRKHGFEVIGTHSFRMGNELQTDFIMRKTL